jgi:hypothetical protein
LESLRFSHLGRGIRMFRSRLESEMYVQWWCGLGLLHGEAESGIGRRDHPGVGMRSLKLSSNLKSRLVGLTFVFFGIERIIAQYWERLLGS